MMTETMTDFAEESMSEEKVISPGEVVIGQLAGVDSLGRPLVTFDGMAGDSPLAAVSTQTITATHVGRQAALLFADGETGKPVIMGLIHNPLAQLLEDFTPGNVPASDSPFPEAGKEYANITALQRDREEQVIVDGKHVVIEGAEEITLKCGKASITLTKSGKILIRGTYLSNRSSGVNRILGGSVQIN